MEHQRPGKDKPASTVSTTKPQRAKPFWGETSRQELSNRAQDPSGMEQFETMPEISAPPIRPFDASRVGTPMGPRVIIQPKLRIAQPGDHLEEEADRVAEQVIRPGTPPSGTMREAAPPFPTISRSISSASAAAITTAPPVVESALATTGEQLEPEVREQFSERMGTAFDGVRIHADGAAAESAAAIGARAYTSGRDIVFGAGEYRPGTMEGDRLLAHELTHVVQQGGPQGVLQREEKEKPTVPQQKDVPGESPSTYLVGKSEEIRIDADGDQHKELLMTLRQEPAPEGMSAEKYFSVRVQIQHVGSSEIAATAFPVRRSPGRDKLFTIVEDVTDGKNPTKLALMVDGRPQLLIYPPTLKGKNQHYRLDLNNPTTAELGNGEKAPSYTVTLNLPASRKKHDNVFAPATQQSQFGITTLDIALGAYKDNFKIIARPLNKDKLLLGIVAVNDAGLSDGEGVELSFPADPFLAGYDPDLEQTTVHAANMTVVSNDGVSLGLDFNGDNNADVVLYDKLTASRDADPKEDRKHALRITGPALAQEKIVEFKREYGWMRPANGTHTGDNKLTTSYALASQSLKEQTVNSAFQTQIDTMEGYLRGLRTKAFTDKLITPQTYNAWVQLDADITQLRLTVSDPSARKESVEEGKDSRVVPPALVSSASKHAAEFYKTLGEETRGEAEVTNLGNSLRNNYVDETITTVAVPNPYGYPSVSTTVSGAGPELAPTIESDKTGHWEDAFRQYSMLESGLDLWIAKQRTEKGGSPHEEIAREAQVAARHRDLAQIARADLQRVYASYYPDPDLDTEENQKLGYAREIPLYLYYWGDEKKWHLEDLTNPGYPYRYDVERKEGETTPNVRLIKEMDDSYRYPPGLIQFSIGNGSAGTIRTTKHVTWRDFVKIFQYVALGLAAVGTLATLGTGGIAVFGLWALAGSAVAQGISSTIDLIGKAKHHELTSESAIIDLALIVSSIAGVTELVTGKIILEATEAANAGKPWVGEMKARYAVYADRIFLPAKITRMGADIITVATVSAEIGSQLDAIQKGPGSQSEKDRAKLILLTSLAANAGIIALSIKGELPSFGPRRELRLYFPDKAPTGELGGVPSAILSGMEAPTSLKFSQSTVNYRTSEGVELPNLSESIKKGWKGEPVDVVEWEPGNMTSLDNRRVDASLESSVAEIPVNYHHPNEPFPTERAKFIDLKHEIRQLPDGTLMVGGAEGKVVYHVGDIPKNWGEAVTFRAANQKPFKRGAKVGEPFPLQGSYERPFITNQPKKSTYGR